MIVLKCIQGFILLMKFKSSFFFNLQMWEPRMLLSRVKNGSPLMLNRKERLKNTFLLEGEYHNLFHLYPVVAFSKLHMQGYEFLASFYLQEI